MKRRLSKKVVNFYVAEILWHLQLDKKLKTIGAVLYHCSNSSTEQIRHLKCPKESDTWCLCQKDILTEENRHKNASIRKVIKETLL